MNQKERKKYYNDCRPDEALLPGDPRNVDIDAIGGEVDHARGSSWVSALADHIELSQDPVCEFFTGLKGSGKSTELLRLAERLRDKQGTNLLTVVIDAEEELDIFNPIDVPDILVMTLHQVERSILEKEGRSPDDALEEGYISRIAHWLLNTTVQLSSLQIGAKVSGGSVEAKKVLEFKTDPSFRKAMRERITQHLGAYLEHVRKETEALAQRAHDVGYKGIVTIVDSLDKHRGVGDNWDDVLSSAEKIFAGGAPYIRLPPMHMIYTIPPALAWRHAISVHFLPMLKIHDRNGRWDESTPGYEAARQLIAKRLPDKALKEIFGQEYEKRVSSLIAWSGGFPREIVRILRACIRQAPVSEPLFRRTLSTEADNYQRTVLEEALPLLARVRHEKRLPIEQKQRELVDQLLTNNVILRYQNDSEWFDLHPALHDWPPLLAEMNKE